MTSGRPTNAVQLGGFSLITEDVAVETNRVAQMCDQCQICDHGGDCWDFGGDGDDQDDG